MVIEMDSSSPELPTSRVREKKSGLLVFTKEIICDAIQNHQSTLIAHQMSARPDPTPPSPQPPLIVILLLQIWLHRISLPESVLLMEYTRSLTVVGLKYQIKVEF